MPTCPREIGKEDVRLPVGVFPEGLDCEDSDLMKGSMMASAFDWR